MCGIIGALKAEGDAVVDGISVLKKLEYRGYDSAGMAILDDNGEIKLKKAVGKIANLEELIKKDSSFESTITIGHTRWATHGKVSVENSHPHFTDKVAVVHNGIIENYKEIKSRMEQAGYTFKTQTDTESIAVLLTYFIDSGLDFKDAFTKTIQELEGGFAIVAICKGQKDILAFAKNGSPMVLGKAKNGDLYISSDTNAFADFIETDHHLNDGDFGFATLKKIELYNVSNINNGQNVAIEPTFTPISKDEFSNNLGEFETYMLKEIMEQPAVIGGIINHYFDIKNKVYFKFPDFPFSLSSVKEINIVACGTSYHAGLTSAYYFEKYAGVNVNCHIASEFKYRNYNFKKGGIFIFISQSGETADTISALKLAKENGQHIVSLVNTPHSNIDKLSDATLYCYASVETGVASTKAFTAQLSILIMLALRIGMKKHIIHRAEGRALARVLLTTGTDMSKVMRLKEQAKSIAEQIIKARNIMVVGRNVSYGIAMEGALKIKEITYIPTDALSAGELKHGSIALIDKETPVIVIGIPDHTFQKTCSNVEEILARGGKVIMLSDKLGVERFKDQIFAGIVLPDTDNLIAPLLYVIVLQFISYYMARALGNDIDKPRNLAKSVTVE